MLAYQYLQALPQIAAGASNKIWIVPVELTKALEGIGGALGGLKLVRDRRRRRPWRTGLRAITRRGHASWPSEAAAQAAAQAAAAAAVAAETRQPGATAGALGLAGPATARRRGGRDPSKA